jgi:hypothetical protein
MTEPEEAKPRRRRTRGITKVDALMAKIALESLRLDFRVVVVFRQR